MSLSFEHWDGSAALADVESESAQSFPFSEDLKELEASLAMSFAESMAARRQAEDALLDANRTATVAEEPAALDSQQTDAAWAAMTAQVAAQVSADVAEQVAVHLEQVDSPLRKELAQQRRLIDEYYRDNRLMAEQVRQLLQERERLTQLVQAYEMDKIRYRHLLGNLYFRL